MRKEYVIKQVTNGYILRVEDGLEVSEKYFASYANLLMELSDEVSTLMQTERERLEADHEQN